ncbi:type VI secretion system-associated FHA domain protein TagH [Paraburkholderia humisilvae]|uniref:FHA domain-containing protein n=1 Tax=Paraburkholderia humisilvae TaxID=627669 RepID=A0A6J5DDC3_9BURK|nr:type VI secretion system-associated FHA domain protein TagH [Paraburkholderia humisilvae]CAB3751142.1 hypothetical protein LMG29542_01423 [Paraburkholderia humisilvae]
MSSEPSLILAVRGEQAERFGSGRQKSFDGHDGSIGRSEECDWVLSAEGVSRLHALVRYLNGIYFIEDRSTNGVLLNGAPLRRGDPAALKDGDRLQIDAFEVSVRIGAQGDSEDRTMWQTPASDPAHHAQTDGRHPGERRDVPAASEAWSEPAPSRDLQASPGASSSSPGEFHVEAHGQRGASYGTMPPDAIGADGLIPGSSGMPLPGASVDPLALFDAPSSYIDEPAAFAPPVSSWNHTPTAADRFRPPQVEAVRHNTPLLPEDWDLSDSQLAPPRKRPAQAEPTLAPAVDVEPASATPPPVTPEPAPLAEPPEPLQSQPFAQMPEPVWTEHAEAKAEAPSPALDQSFVAAPASSVEPAMPDTADTPASLVAAAPAAQPEQAERTAVPVPARVEPRQQQLEAMFHIVIDGLMDVLRARAELKNSFRMPATLIQRAENNPLKFAPNADEAVRKLLAPPNSAFLSGNAALNDAVSDIRNHQMAMLAGVRSAFQSLLAQFDPARIEREAGGAARRLPFGQGQRYWERYREQFDAMTRNPDESFRRLFGDEFARAYEEQLARLKSGRG